jgi:hypothetical protein
LDGKVMLDEVSVPPELLLGEFDPPPPPHAPRDASIAAVPIKTKILDSTWGNDFMGQLREGMGSAGGSDLGISVRATE